MKVINRQLARILANHLAYNYALPKDISDNPENYDFEIKTPTKVKHKNGAIEVEHTVIIRKK
jgi:hypothetical protein